MTDQNQRVIAQFQLHDEPLRRAAIRVSATVKARLPLQGARVYTHPMPNSPLKNLSVAGRVSPDLTTSPGAVDAGHYAEQCFAVTGLHYLGSYRRPNSVRP